MAVRLEVTPTGLRVHFSGTDLLAACSQGLFVPYTRVLGVRVMTRADAVASSPRFPSPGLWWSQRYRAGCWGVGERRQLWSARQGTHVVVIYLTGRPFHRVVVEVDEPERAHRRIDAALLRSKKTSARRSIRSHRRSAPARGSASAMAPLLEGQREAGSRSCESVSPTPAPPPPWSSSAIASGTHHDRAATEDSAPSEIDPSVAARLRLYEYRSSLSRGQHPNRTCLDA
ncbi:hypothetical protein PHK61_31265 [Actinomycetospora lutea]|uniref:hypothetical protein n=1 Tax=Actinomycetospora lutea TaxID=663604 RepID=UPI002365A93F|nr:hypothetical protein [Actinomycetospora lutea]MDD7942899.1 hypothetical protein [Actinomycetospora lutea]